MVLQHSVMIYVKLLMTAVFWGGTFVAGRTLAGHVGPFSAAFLRFSIASIFLLYFILKIEGRLPVPGRKGWAALLLLGMTGVFSYNVFFFKGLEMVEAGRASLIIANNPVFITLLSALLFKEKLSWIKLAGVVLSVSGAMVVITRGRLFTIAYGGIGWGELFIFCCVLSWVIYSLIGKTVMTELSALIAVSYSTFIGTAALLAPAWAEGLWYDLTTYRLVDWISLFYLGFFGTVIGFVWYYEGIRHIGPSRAGQFINFVPISAVVLAASILGEPITASLIVGTVLVVSGVYLTNRRPSSRFYGGSRSSGTAGPFAVNSENI